MFDAVVMSEDALKRNFSGSRARMPAHSIRREWKLQSWPCRGIERLVASSQEAATDVPGCNGFQSMDNERRITGPVTLLRRQ